MKRIISTALLGLGFCSIAMGKPAEIYQNLGPNTNTPTIDATIFYNQSIFDTTTDFAISNANPDLNSGFSGLPYSTGDTLYYTNTSSGSMEGVPGFRFDTLTSTTRYSASSFDNDGTVTAFDLEALPVLFTVPPAKVYVADVADSQPLPSQLQVYCTNILNDGTLAVGNYGLMQLVGSNVSTQNGVLIAGAVNTGSGFELDPLDQTSGADLLITSAPFYVNPAGVYDLFWGVTNGGTLALPGFNPPISTIVQVGTRGGFTGAPSELPFNANAQFASYVYTFPVDASNTEYNIVLVNTNFTGLDGQPNTNMTAAVEFSFDNFACIIGGQGDQNQSMAIIQFAMPVFDVVTGTTVTNAVYLLDDGGNFAAMADLDNASAVNGYSRPNAFIVTTETPEIWEPTLFANQGNATYDPTLIWEPNTYSGKDVGYTAALYGVQIGRNPGELDGGFNFTESNEFFITTNGGTEIFTGEITAGLEGAILLPDPTNEPARIEITANELNLSNSRLRAEGMVIMNASNVVGNTFGSDWGQINCNLGATNGSLVISNIFPTNFQRLRGDIYAWSGNWVNTVTNGFTNTYHYHLLIVDQNLAGNFQSAVRNLSLTGTNSIDVVDPLYVINQSYINTTNLTFNSNTVFTQNAGNFTAANAPNLKYFLNNTNANWSVDGLIDIGYNETQLAAPPERRKYTVSNIVNLGTITATSPLFESELFENDGSITANNSGSMVIEAAFLGLGLDLTNVTNTLQSDGNITLSALSIEAVNSQIFAGVGTNSRGTLLLQTAANGQITDFVSGAPGTNNVLTNFWVVTDGFSLPIKPATGDLFGTEIETIATGTTVALHTWSGVDLGASSAGFADNVVIGHLKLSRQSSNALLHFTGAGAQNGMYVDYLEFDTNSLSGNNTGYREGLLIDSNLTIYFAACNLDPIKIETVYTNRLVWVPSFAGPNSTVAVPYLGSSNVCLMNTNLAFSHEIAFFPGTPNADNQPYVLNNPSNPTNTYPCPGENTTFKDFIIITGPSDGVTVQLSTKGQGTITPNLKQSQVVMGREYELTATPARGWVFGGWTSIGLPAGVDTTGRTLKFKIEDNLALTALFTPEPFTLVKGSYYGLFSNNAPSPVNSGWFSLTLGENGALSGRLLMGPATYTINGIFPTNGTAQLTAKDGKQTLTVDLNLDLANPTGQITGDVTDGTWTSPLLGYAAPTIWTAKTSSPYAGQYTLILTNNDTNMPIGFSYGSLAISKPGLLSIAGKLADGEPFSQSVPISSGGLWPFYTYVPHGEDFLLGWIAFRNNAVNSSIAPTNIFWNKGSASKDGFYPAGFSSEFSVVGSPYTFPGATSSGLSLTAPVLVFSGDGMGSPVIDSVTNNGRLTYSGTNLTLSINPWVGSFTGRLKDSSDGPSVKLNGVVLQNQDSAFGFFPGTNNESGSLQLQDQ